MVDAKAVELVRPGRTDVHQIGDARDRT